jgi:DNA invertase Pin-like site-specific DNA recombinase
MALVRQRKVEVLVVTKLDRLARSLSHLITLIEEFRSLNILFVSIGDQIDLSTASGRLMVQIVAAFAEFERALVRERTVAGLAYAKSKGKRLGRPPTADTGAIRALKAEGLTDAMIRKKLGVSKGAVWRALKDAPKSPQSSLGKKPMKTRGD